MPAICKAGQEKIRQKVVSLSSTASLSSAGIKGAILPTGHVKVSLAAFR